MLFRYMANLLISYKPGVPFMGHRQTERGVPSGAILFAQRKFVEKWDKNSITPNTPKNESGLNQLIALGESIRQIWVNEVLTETI